MQVLLYRRHIFIKNLNIEGIRNYSFIYKCYILYDILNDYSSFVWNTKNNIDLDYQDNSVKEK